MVSSHRFPASPVNLRPIVAIFGSFWTAIRRETHPTTFPIVTPMRFEHPPYKHTFENMLGRAHTCVFEEICVIYIYVCVWVCVRVCVCVYIYIYTCTYSNSQHHACVEREIYTHVKMYVYLYLCMYVCVCI